MVLHSTPKGCLPLFCIPQAFPPSAAWAAAGGESWVHGSAVLAPLSLPGLAAAATENNLLGLVYRGYSGTVLLSIIS